MFFSIFKKLKKAKPEDEEKLVEAMRENDVGAKDTFAMILSAFLVIVLPCLLILCAFCAVVLLLMGAF